MIYAHARVSTGLAHSMCALLNMLDTITKAGFRSLGGTRLPEPLATLNLILRAYAPGEALIRVQPEPHAFPLPPINLVE
jgi:hypothetical protein